MNRSSTSTTGPRATALFGAVLLAILMAGCVIGPEPACTSCPASGACFLTDSCGNPCFYCDSGSYCADDGYCYCTPDCPMDGPCYLTDGCGNDCFYCEQGAYCASDGYCYY